MTRLGILLGVWFALNAGAFGRDITVRFEVSVPRHFLGESRFFIAGNLPALGKWEPDRAALEREGSIFTKTIVIPEATPMEFKITRGKWKSPEIASKGAEVPNRTAQCQRDCTLKIEVENFRLPTFHAVPVSATNSVFYHHEFYSEALDNYRNIAVYLPPQYFTEPDRHFPVLYSLDGNNLFDVATMGSRYARDGEDGDEENVRSERWEEWRLDKTLDEAFTKGRLKPFIVVGIYNTKRRADEYVPCHTGAADGGDGGFAGQYADFLTGTIKPFIDRTYRTLPDRLNTALMGASFGGTFTLYAAKTRPQVFSRFVAMSTAYWPGNRCLFGWLKTPASPLPERLWMDMGDQEEVELSHFAGAVNDLHEGHKLLKQSGVPDSRIQVVVEKGGYHNEVDWGRRVERALKFVFEN